jgi:hypothetical protein
VAERDGGAPLFGVVGSIPTSLTTRLQEARMPFSQQVKNLTGDERPLEVLRSAAGYYLGTLCEEGMPYSRDSGYYPTFEAAAAALQGLTFAPRLHP